MTNRKVSPLLIISIILIVIIAICLFHPGLFSFFTVLITLLLASVLMVLHMVLAWSKLTVTYRLSILLCIVAWLAMFCGLVRMN